MELTGLRRIPRDSILAASVDTRRNTVSGRQLNADPLGRMKMDRSVPNLLWMSYLAATIAGLMVFIWAIVILFAAISALTLFAATTLQLGGSKVVAGALVLLCGLVSLGGGLIAAIFVGRRIRAFTAGRSILIGLLSVLLLLTLFFVLPTPFVYVLK